MSDERQNSTPLARVDLELAAFKGEVTTRFENVYKELGKLEASTRRSHQRLDFLNGMKKAMAWIATTVIGGIAWTILNWEKVRLFLFG